MNTHKTKNRTRVQAACSQATYPPINRKLVERDTMPIEVATEMLARPGLRMTNRERKQYQAARCRIFCSTLEPKPVETVIEKKFKAATWAQLIKWRRRSERAEKGVLAALHLAQTRLGELEAEKPTDKTVIARTGAQIVLLEKAIAALYLKGSQIQVVLEALADEMDRRKDFCSRLREASPSTADKLETALCPTAGQ